MDSRVESEGEDDEDETSLVTTNVKDASTASTPTVASDTKKIKKKKKKRGRLVINCTNTRYPVIHEVAADMGFIEEVDEEDGTFSIEQLGQSHTMRSECSLLWTDSITSLARIVKTQGWQRYNHFPTMHVLCRKVHLSHTLGRMRKLFPTFYTFFPRTWSLRSEKPLFRKHATTFRNKPYIIKPNGGCQGRGIILTKDPLAIIDELDDHVAQEYIAKPLLIEGKKFDMRVYVLVTCVKPLSLFVYHEGLIRMCAEDYQKPTDDNVETMSMHLTNYAVNKQSDKYVPANENNPEEGNKRNFAWFRGFVEGLGHNWQQLWDRIDNIVCKALISAQPQLSHVFTTTFSHDSDGYTCFELLGLDVLIDQQMKPWLLEVNHAPSLTCDTPLDHTIKYNLLKEVFTIARIRPDDKFRVAERDKELFMGRMEKELRRKENRDPKVVEKERVEEEKAERERVAAVHAERRKYEDKHCVGFRRVYPPISPSKAEIYRMFLVAAAEANVAPSTLASEQRAKELSAQREKVQREKEKELGQQSSALAPKGERKGSFPSEDKTGVGASSGRATLKARTDSVARGVLAALSGSDVRKKTLDARTVRPKRRMSLGPKVSGTQLREESAGPPISNSEPIPTVPYVPEASPAPAPKSELLAQRLKEAIWRASRHSDDDEDEEVEEE